MNQIFSKFVVGWFIKDSDGILCDIIEADKLA